jgi:transcription elongation factor Elf1
MAGPIALAAALARTRKLTCPHCGAVKLVGKEPRATRQCPRCKRRFADPLAAKPKLKPRR